MKRTKLIDKYKAIKSLEISQRTFGESYVPCYRKLAKELNMSPQLLRELWKRKEAISERAQRKLTARIIEQIDHDMKWALLKSSAVLQFQIDQLNFSKIPNRQFIKLFHDLSDMLYKLQQM